MEANIISGIERAREPESQRARVTSVAEPSLAVLLPTLNFNELSFGGFDSVKRSNTDLPPDKSNQRNIVHLSNVLDRNGVGAQ